MRFEDLRALMKEAGWGILATSDGQKVVARPTGGWAWMRNELWCATGNSSDKIAQLRDVHYAEYCFCTKEGKHARIVGPCKISSSYDDKLRLYKAVPALQDHIEHPASPWYVVIRMKPQRIRAMALSDIRYEEIELV